MRPGDIVTLAALLFLVAAGWLRRISPSQQRQVTALGVLGTALIATTQALSVRFPAAAQVVGDWLPGLLMLIVYWQAGRFFGRPAGPLPISSSGASHGTLSAKLSEKLQASLAEFDRRRLGALLDPWARRWSTTWIGTYFELAYLLCYALIPCGVAALYWTHQRSAIDRYWAVVLPASYLCYLIVPFVQTLPPRLLPGTAYAPGAGQKIRAFNLFILRRGSIHLNTFPSAHVASTVGASLVLMRYVPAVGVVFLLIALSIAAGAVLGRYHYALDVIFGAMLPLGIRCLLR